MKNLIISSKYFILLFSGLCLSSIAGFATEEYDQMLSNLSSVLPADVVLDNIELSPMENVYIVKANKQEFFVYSKDEFILVGDIWDTARNVSLTNERRQAKMVGAVAAVPESEMIMMGESLGRYVTVFTDTDCFYCQKFHVTVPELQSRGLQVRYMMFPRAGVGSDSYLEAVSVWCSKNQAEAMTLAKAGGTVDPVSCENPVATQYQLGQDIGVTGTPTLILDNGLIIPGFVEPKELLARAGIE